MPTRAVGMTVTTEVHAATEVFAPEVVAAAVGVPGGRPIFNAGL